MLANGQIISGIRFYSKCYGCVGPTIKTWEFSSPVSSFHGLSQNRFLCAHTDGNDCRIYPMRIDLESGWAHCRNVSR